MTTIHTLVSHHGMHGMGRLFERALTLPHYTIGTALDKASRSLASVRRVGFNATYGCHHLQRKG